MKSLWQKWTMLPLSSQLIPIFIVTTIFTIVTNDDSISSKKCVAYSTAALICSFFIPKDYHL